MSLKYKVLKYVCVISLELVIAACVYNYAYENYKKSDETRFAIEKQLNKSEEDNVVFYGGDGESLKKAFENRIQKGEIIKKVPGKYRCKFTSVYKFKNEPVFSKYYIYNKKTNKKVGEGYIALAFEMIGDSYRSIESNPNYISYIKVDNPDNPDENYIVKEPGSVMDFEFEKIEEEK